MAKGKHSTALFEVIHSAKRPEAVAQTLRTPKWWFKGSLPPKPATLAEPSFSEPDPVEALEPPAPRRHIAGDRASSERAPSERGGRSAVHVDFDRDRKQITLRLRYTTALASAFGVCVLVAMAFVIGRHISRGPQTASAGETQHVKELLAQPPQQGVADIRPHQPRTQVISPSEPRRPVEPQNTTHPRASASGTLIPAGVESSLPRTVGLQYVIIASYPPAERQAAQDACDYLTRNGIPCTLEHIPEFSAHWTCLVGTAGFQHLHSAEYDDYVSNILRLGEKYQTSHFDQFKPTGFKWRGN